MCYDERMAENHSCRQCGAGVTGLICQFCGSLTGSVKDIETEAKALEDLHRLVQISEKERQADLLKNGFLPENRTILIKAGFRCMPLADQTHSADKVCAAALRRLETIITLLQLMEKNAESDRALAEFEKFVTDYKRACRNVIIIFYVVVVVVIALIVWGIHSCSWFSS